MILAGDIGGTNSRIAVFREEAGRLALAQEKVYPSREHKGLGEIISGFLTEYQPQITHAAFGIAGPVFNGRVSTPNLPWTVDAAELSRLAGINSLALINDLEAHASGVDDLEPSDLVALNSATPAPGNSALIAAGTGLGEAGFYWDGNRRHAFPCEGGHTDFAARNELEIALLQDLAKKFGRVSYERVLSGPGLKNVYDFLVDSGREQEPAWLHDELAHAVDPTALISKYALQQKVVACEHSLDLFISIFGAEAGNLALKLMAVNGVFISGGIAGHILPRLQDGTFMQSFIAKGRLQPLLEKIPVKVITNDRVGLIGAARYAFSKQTSPDRLAQPALK